ncbi:30S ribosomal protein [Niveomyces insectorum RCEF 264]|uniref:Small ribosomal subunit protein uS7m n=1 Tax=Niveomyces insectorum RCEF 264 TaxID=1081102 RepID=A0A167ZYU1_9HYPO|nr:30S ribosomal protein [Niveomyces insectorum RCEF 264]
MPASRLAPLWRRSGQCLVLRTAKPAAAAVARRVTTAAASLSAARVSFRPRVAPAARPLAAPAAYPAARGYAGDATTRGDGDNTGGDAQRQEDVLAYLAAQAAAGGERQTPPSGQVPQDQQTASRSPSEGHATTPGNQTALRYLELLSQGLAPFDPFRDGHKFGLTTATTRTTTNLADAANGGDAVGLPLPQAPKLQERYHPVITQLTRLLMRHGKLAKAQRDMAMVLNILRTSPPPKFNPARPLLPGHPPAARLPLDPVTYLTLAIDSVAPLIMIRNYTGMAGGGRALPVPAPLAARQRRRVAFMWLLELVNKKPSRGSGRGMLASRVAEEVVAIVEGRSSLWEKRQQVHKQGTSARINVATIAQRQQKGNQRR